MKTQEILLNSTFLFWLSMFWDYTLHIFFFIVERIWGLNNGIMRQILLTYFKVVFFLHIETKNINKSSTLEVIFVMHEPV